MLCENCIVDANAIIIMATAMIVVVVCFSFCGFCSWYFLLSVRDICVFCLRAHGGCLGMLSR